MNYLKIYNKLINKNEYRKIKKEQGYEIHHIVPKSVGGSDSNENLVKLSYREHFIAHLLLTKIYPNSEELLYSAWKFTYSKDGHVKVNNSKIHKILKEKYIKSVSLILDEQELRDFFMSPSATIRQASLKFSCHWDTIRKNMDYYNIAYLWDGLYTEKYTKEEIIDFLTKEKFITLREISEKYNIKYWKLNSYIKEYKLEYLRPKLYTQNVRNLYNYIISGATHIKRHKLHLEFNTAAGRVTKYLKEWNIEYIDDEMKTEIKYINFIIELFSIIPHGYSKSGFSKYIKKDFRTIIKILNKNNIKYNFGYKQHKGKEYNERIKPVIQRGINRGIFKE